MTKTKKFKLLNNRITIVYQDKVTNEDNEWIFGKCEYVGPEMNVYVSTKDIEGKQMKDEDIEMTVRHELFHIILDALYFEELSKNETLVEWLANATYELHKQGLSI